MTAHSLFSPPLLLALLALLVSCPACSSTGATPDAPAADASPDSTATLSDASANDAAPPQPVADATTTDALSDAAPPSDARPDATPDAAHPPDASPDPSADAAASPFHGAIFATSDSTSSPDGGAQLDYSAGGYFVHTTAPDMSVTESTVGPCLVQIYGSGTGPVETPLSAGSVQIAGGKTPLTLLPDGTKNYTTIQASDSNLWNGAETITVTAAGADVPAFTTNLAAPSKITLATPALPPASGALTVPRNAPWNATWTGTSSGVVVIYFDETDGANAYAVTCSFDASLGTAEVPTAAFSPFVAGSGTFDFYVKTTAAPVLAGWDIHFNATSAIVDATGAGAAGSTTYP